MHELRGVRARPRRSPRDWSFVRQVLEGANRSSSPTSAASCVRAGGLPAGRNVAGVRGIPLVASGGRVNGAMCLFDLEPLALDARALDALGEIGNRLALELDSSIERADSQERFSALSRLALTDQVTGLANRRGGEEALVREVSRAAEAIGAVVRASRARDIALPSVNDQRDTRSAIAC